jgi:hypothetical protein
MTLHNIRVPILFHILASTATKRCSVLLLLQMFLSGSAVHMKNSCYRINFTMLDNWLIQQPPDQYPYTKNLQLLSAFEINYKFIRVVVMSSVKKNQPKQGYPPDLIKYVGKKLRLKINAGREV